MKLSYVTQFHNLKLKPIVQSSFGYRGLIESLQQGLLRSGVDLEYLHEEHKKLNLFKRFFLKLFNLSKGYQTYSASYGSAHKRTSRALSKKISQSKGRSNSSIFTAENSRIFYGTDFKQKLYCYTDAPITSLVHEYEHLKNLSPQCIAEVLEVERESLLKLHRLFVPTAWAEKSFLKICPELKNRVKIVGYGPGFSDELAPTQSEFEALLEKRARKNYFSFLFNGADWVRKGGDRAVQIIKRLNESGFPSKLIVVGCQPNIIAPEYLIPAGIINKFEPSELSRLLSLYREADFLLLPTLADAAGAVFIEAKMFGVVPIGSTVMGVPDVVGPFGLCCDLKSDIQVWVDQIVPLLNRKELTSKIRLCQNDYLVNQTWHITSERLRGFLEEAEADNSVP